MTIRRAAILALAVVVLLTGCRERRESPRAADRLTIVRLNVGPSMTYAPVVIAKEEGYFKDEGIDAQFESLDSPSALVATAAGKLDVLSMGIGAGVFNLILKGARMRVVADKTHSTGGDCDHAAFIASVATADRIAAHGGSLRGEKLATARGGLMEYLFDRLLERSGTAPGETIAIQLPRGAAPSTREKTDAIRFVNEPDLTYSLSAGWAKVVAPADAVAPGHQSAVLVYGRRMLDDPDLGRRFMRAYLRGVRQYLLGKTPRNVEIISRYTKVPPDVVRRACWPAIAADGRVEQAAIQPFLDWALEKKYLDAPAPMSAWWDPAFIEAAARQPGPR